MQKIKIEMSSNYALVSGIRTCIARIAYNFDFDDRESYQIETVADEICNNAIEHSGVKDKKIRIECRFDKGKIELMVKDNGNRKFDAQKIFQRNLELLQEEISKGCETVRRGRGLIIVQKLVDKLDIKTGKNGTVVKIFKKSNKSRLDH